MKSVRLIILLPLLGGCALSMPGGKNSSSISESSLEPSEFVSSSLTDSNDLITNSLSYQETTGIESISVSPITSLSTSESTSNIESKTTNVVSSTQIASSTSYTQTSTTYVRPTSSTYVSSKPTSSSKPSSTSLSKTSSTSYIPSDIEGREVLPCGYVKLDKPTNSPIIINTSYSSSDWFEAMITDDFPSNDWTHIYGNSCSKWPSPHYYAGKFYSYDASDTKQYPGGVKLDQRSKGFQTPLFSHTGNKLEIRLGVSQMNNSSTKPTAGQPVAYFYFYNSDGDFLIDKTITIGDSEIDSKTTEIKKYVYGASSVAYFEFRLNQLPFKSSQSYNIGIGKVSIHSWPQE